MNYYCQKVDGYGQLVANVIGHVEKVNRMNIDLAVELEKVYAAIQREKEIGANLEADLPKQQ